MIRSLTLALALSLTAAQAEPFDYRDGGKSGAWTQQMPPRPPAVDGDGIYATADYGGLMIAECPDVPLPVDQCTFVEINKFYPQTGTHILIEVRKGPNVLVIVYGDGRVIGDPRMLTPAGRALWNALFRAYPGDMHARRR